MRLAMLYSEPMIVSLSSSADELTLDSLEVRDSLKLSLLLLDDEEEEEDEPEEESDSKELFLFFCRC